jgi:hypothetical protein
MIIQEGLVRAATLIAVAYAWSVANNLGLSKNRKEWFERFLKDADKVHRP